MDSYLAPDHLDLVDDAPDEYRGAMVSDTGQDPGGLVPLAVVMVRLLTRLDARRVR